MLKESYLNQVLEWAESELNFALWYPDICWTRACMILELSLLFCILKSFAKAIINSKKWTVCCVLGFAICSLKFAIRYFSSYFFPWYLSRYLHDRCNELCIRRSSRRQYFFICFRYWVTFTHSCLWYQQGWLVIHSRRCWLRHCIDKAWFPWAAWMALFMWSAALLITDTTPGERLKSTTLPLTRGPAKHQCPPCVRQLEPP